MSSIRFAWLAAPSLALGLLWLPVRFGVTQVDSPRTEMFGAPLPWRSPSIVFSMVTDVYWGPLLLDAAFWLVVAFGLVHLWKRHAPSSKVVNLCAGLAVATAGMVGGLYMALMVLFGATAGFWYDGSAMTFRSLGLS